MLHLEVLRHRTLFKQKQLYSLKLLTCFLFVKNGEGSSNLLQYSCPGNPMDREAGGLQSMGLKRVGHN